MTLAVNDKKKKQLRLLLGVSNTTADRVMENLTYFSLNAIADMFSCCLCKYKYAIEF